MGRRGSSWGAAVSLAIALAGVPAFARHIQKKFRVGSHPVVTLRNSSGKVTIHSWPKPEVQLAADPRSDKVEVDAGQQGNMVEVTTHLLTDNITPSELEADIQLTVPEETELSIHNDSGEVDIQKLLGDVSVETVAADANLEGVTGYITVHTVGGTFTCNQCSGRIEANSISGAINLLDSESSNVQVRTSTGNIMLDSDLLPNGLYQLRNYSGQIDVLFSPSDSFDVTAISMRGRVENEAKLKQSPRPSHHLPPFARSLIGQLNEGKARLIINSFSGTILIRRRP
ncbi:MAG TPA: DUF4097 family beta strand repeat-containing protein [Candidatus Acidoferrales bacterium]|nr:DUF4097 family beta strand repeat-containing protein [Candidatus Acidoferrales bacterium]